MKGRILGTLFALPFAGVGVWMLWSIGSTMHDAWQMRGWVQVEATLIKAGYETRSGDDSETYEAYAEYRYRFQLQEYAGNRVGINSGADNIGDYQQDIGRTLRAAKARGEKIVVFVDPDEPSASIVDPSVRWGLAGFKLIFVIVFGGVGFGLLYAVWRAPPEKDKTDPAYADTPWLLNDDWQTSTIRSGSKASMWGAWAFAIFWNAISSAAPFLAYREIVEKGNFVALIALLFPLVGIGLLTWAIRRTLEWRRFGPAPVVLDPFPGAIGGHVGGTIDVNLPFDPKARFQLTLTNLHSYESGSGKNRSRKEKAKWQDAIVAHAEPSGRGTRLTFRFDVPDGLHESDADPDDSYYAWRLNLEADLPGTNLDRDYDIPVYATGQRSRHLSSYAIERARSDQASLDAQAVRKRINLEYKPSGKRLHFPMGRFLGGGIGGLLVGAIFAGAGWFLVVQEGQKVFGSIFGLMGTLIAIFCLYLIFNSLEVVQTATGIRTTRRVLGIPVGGAELRRDQIVALDKKSTMQAQSGGKHIVYYDVYARDHAGEKYKIAEGFQGDSEANAAIRLIAAEFGIRVPEGRLDEDEDPLGDDIAAQPGGN